VTDDGALVLDAAALLQVSAHDLFRIAWRKWHGGEIGDAQLERHYRPYMRDGRVPIWVHELARRITADAAADRLKPERYVVRPSPPTDASTHPGRRYGLWLAVVLGVLLTVAAVTELASRSLRP
jgi:hypothetical protein